MILANSFELFLLDSRNGNDILALARRGADTAIEVIPIDVALSRLAEFGRHLGRVVTGDAQRPTDTCLLSFGRELFEFLFRGTLRELYIRLPKDGAFSLQILSDHPGIKQVPWEYLELPDKQPTPHRDRSVIRVHPTCGIETPVPRKIKKKVVKILFVSADPVDQRKVPWSDVLGVIQRTFGARTPEGFSIKIIQGASRASLIAALQIESFDIFHFLGHGILNAKNEGQLVLQDIATEKTDLISARELASLLSGKKIQLAILSACSSSAGNHVNDFGAIATALIVAGVPAVVANQYPIPYKSISPFVESIYLSLLRDGDIDHAVAEGRIAMLLNLGSIINAGDAAFEWGIPTLYRLADARKIFQT